MDMRGADPVEGKALVCQNAGADPTSARGWIALWAHRLDAVWLNLLPGALPCAKFAAALAFGFTLAGAAACAFCYGAGNGIAAITRGSMSLLPFAPGHYGRIVGRIVNPAFMLAAAPIALTHFGPRGTLALVFTLSALLLDEPIALLRRHALLSRA